SDLRRRPAGLPSDIRDLLAGDEFKPALGAWVELLRHGTLARNFDAVGSFVPGLPVFAQKRAIPALNKMTPIRNLLAHTGRNQPRQIDQWLSELAPIVEGLFFELDVLTGF